MLGFKFVDVRIECGSIPKFFRFYDFKFHAIVSTHVILKRIYSWHTMHLRAKFYSEFLHLCLLKDCNCEHLKLGGLSNFRYRHNSGLVLIGNRNVLRKAGNSIALS